MLYALENATRNARPTRRWPCNDVLLFYGNGLDHYFGMGLRTQVFFLQIIATWKKPKTSSGIFKLRPETRHRKGT